MSIFDLNLIGAKEVCKICNFTNQYLQNLVLREKIPFKKVGGRLVFLLEDVIKFQKNREEKSKNDSRVKIKQ